MEKKKYIALGDLLNEALVLSNEAERFGKIEQLLVAIVFMSTCEGRLISERTLERFTPIFEMVNKMKECVGIEGYEEKSKREMHFLWEEFREWIVKMLLTDKRIKKYCTNYEGMIEYLNEYNVPWFFFDNFLKLYITQAYFFPAGGLLYYLYGAETHEEELIYTFRVLDVQKRDMSLEDGDILYYGADKIEYIKRINAICMKFEGLDWYVCFSLTTKQVEDIFYHRHLIGVTENGEEVFLRDSEDGTKLEVYYVNRMGKEVFVMDYRSDCWFYDGAFHSNVWCTSEPLRRPFKFDIKGKKSYCSMREWKRTIWISMLKGIESSCIDYMSFGEGLIGRMLEEDKIFEPPKVFSCDELERCLWRLRKNRNECKRRTGRLLACLALLRRKGIKGEEDLFDFFKCAIRYWRDKAGGTYLCLKEFLVFLERISEEEEFVKLVRNDPKHVFEKYIRREDRKKILCNSIKEYFGFLLNKGVIGVFGMVDGVLCCQREYIREGELRENVIVMRKSGKKGMTGRVSFDLATKGHVIEWPSDMSFRWLHDVKRRFYITGRWTIVNR